MPNPPEANQPASLGPRETQQRPGVVTTREARAADAGRLAEINVVTWRTAYDGIVPAAYLAGLDIAAVAKRWRARLAERSHERFYFVADVGDGVAAYAIGGPYRTQQDAADEDTAAWGELYALYTHPVCRVAAPAEPSMTRCSTLSPHAAAESRHSGCSATTSVRSGGTTRGAGAPTGPLAGGTAQASRWMRCG